MKHIQYFLIIVVLFFVSKVCIAQWNIADYFSKDPNAWEHTKRIIHKPPIKIVVTDGLEGLVFNLAELTEGDEVALIFLETHTSEKLKQEGCLDAVGKLLPGKNRVVSVITRNSGNRTLLHYKFMLQRNVNGTPISIYNNGNAVLESEYDGSKPVKDISNLSGIEMCEIDIR